MWHAYPYTDLHDLNLDWVINRMKEIEAELENVAREATNAAIEASKEYIDEQLSDITEGFNELKTLVYTLEGDVSDLKDAIDIFENLVNIKIEAIRSEAIAMNEATNSRMEIMIEQNNNYLLNQMESYLSQIKVINFFTGEKVTIQDMFNYLAMLHLTDSITYTVMAVRNKTYTELAGLNITYTDLVEHGNTLYV